MKKKNTKKTHQGSKQHIWHCLDPFVGIIVVVVVQVVMAIVFNAVVMVVVVVVVVVEVRSGN